jgi:hypothetical protein
MSRANDPCLWQNKISGLKTGGWVEMAKMCGLKAPGTKGHPVYVNPRTVRYVQAGKGESTIIHFENDQSINIALPIALVVRELDMAMSDGRL